MVWLKLVCDLMYMIHHEMCGPPAHPEKLLVLGFEDAQIDSGRQERQLPYEPPEELELRLGALSFGGSGCISSHIIASSARADGHLYLRSPAGYPFSRARGAVVMPFFEWYILMGYMLKC